MSGLESLEAWRLGKDVAVRVYRCTRREPLKYHLKLADQIRRAAISVPANIAEGYGLGTRAQLVKGLRIGYGSALELRTHFDIARDIPALPTSEDIDILENDIRRLIALIVGLLKRYDAKPSP